MKTKNPCVRCQAGENSAYHNMTQPQPHTPTLTPGCKCKVKEVDGLDQIVFCVLHVRAVNCHEELLGMLKAALDNLDDKSGGYLTQDIKQAIAKAEGK